MIKKMRAIISVLLFVFVVVAHPGEAVAAMTQDYGAQIGQLKTGSANDSTARTAAAAAQSTANTALGVSGTATVTFTGFTAVLTQTASYSVVGGVVHLSLAGSVGGTSNATTLTMTGLPASVRPTSTRTLPMFGAGDAGLYIDAGASVDTSGVVTFTKSGGAASWTASGTKAIYSTELNWML